MRETIHLKATTSSGKETDKSKGELDRSHLTRNFERGNIDHFIAEDPKDRFYEKYINKKKGSGLFASRIIDRGELIAFYRGEEITEDEFNERERRNDIEYVFWNKDWKVYIDGKNSDGKARLINDCCFDRPNSVARCHKSHSGKRHIKIIAMKTIQKDEEITYDYGRKLYHGAKKRR